MRRRRGLDLVLERDLPILEKHLVRLLAFDGCRLRHERRLDLQVGRDTVKEVLSELGILLADSGPKASLQAAIMRVQRIQMTLDIAERETKFADGVTLRSDLGIDHARCIIQTINALHNLVHRVTAILFDLMTNAEHRTAN